jgi:hypothetical protein
MDIITLASVGALVIERIVVHTITAIRHFKSRCCNCSSCDLSKDDESTSTPRVEIPKNL